MTPEVCSTAVGPIATVASFVAGAGAPLVHFSHATGMCAALYRPLLDRLTPHVNIVASAFRGHGVGAVVMIEPAFVPFAVAPAYVRGAFPNPMAEQAARRRAVWPSRDAMQAAYRGRGVFATWPDTDLDAYVLNAVRDRPDRQVELACAPAWEAATFAAVSTGLAAAVAGWRGSLTLLHGTEGSTVMPADAATIAARPGTVVRRFDGADHFLPLTAPAAMADAILACC